MDIRKEYIKLLNKLERTSPVRFYDSFQLDEMARNSRIGKKWNICNSWDLFIPNQRKPYSILNTDDSSKSGTHWVSVYQTKKNIYVYDSFGRSKKLMKPFVNKMKSMGYTVKFINNNGGEQSENQYNCGLRCLLYLIFIDRYGLTKTRKI